MKQTNHDASPKKPVSPESREKMSNRRKVWWAQKRLATPTQSDISTAPIQNATVEANELNPAPDSAINEAPRSAANEFHPQRRPSEVLPMGDAGADSGILAGNQGAPSGTKTSSKPATKQSADDVGKGQLSPGPRSTGGNQKSSLNHYKHEIYVKQLYPTIAEWEKDGADYQTLACGIRDHYRPGNYMAEKSVEMLAVDNVLLARVTRDQQSYIASKFAFAGPMADRILRTRTSLQKAISREHRELERFQANGQGAFGERTETGRNLWVESAEVIYQGPPKPPEPSSDDRVDAKGGAPSPAQTGQSNSAADFWNSVKTVVPTRAENTPTDSFARLLREAVGGPYPTDGKPNAAASESVKKKPTGE